MQDKILPSSNEDVGFATKAVAFLIHVGWQPSLPYDEKASHREYMCFLDTKTLILWAFCVDFRILSHTLNKERIEFMVASPVYTALTLPTVRWCSAPPHFTVLGVNLRSQNRLSISFLIHLDHTR